MSGGRHDPDLSKTQTPIYTFIEIGPGRTLTGFMRKISREVRTYNISTVEDLKKVVNELCKIH
jgi:[acyl-carrier-protein] S-malonyltransferase